MQRCARYCALSPAPALRRAETSRRRFEQATPARRTLLCTCYQLYSTMAAPGAARRGGAALGATGALALRVCSADARSSQRDGRRGCAAAAGDRGAQRAARGRVVAGSLRARRAAATSAPAASPRSLPSPRSWTACTSWAWRSGRREPGGGRSCVDARSLFALLTLVRCTLAGEVRCCEMLFTIITSEPAEAR